MLGITFAQMPKSMRDQLDAEPASPGVLSPAMAGARLWTDRKDILLEDGGAARFPLETISPCMQKLLDNLRLPLQIEKRSFFLVL